MVERNKAAEKKTSGLKLKSCQKILNQEVERKKNLLKNLSPVVERKKVDEKT